MLFNHSSKHFCVEIGDGIAQMILEKIKVEREKLRSFQTLKEVLRVLAQSGKNKTSR